MTEDSLLCHEVLYPFTNIGESSLQPHYSDSVDSNKDQFKIISTTYDGFPTLDDINTDTQSDSRICNLALKIAARAGWIEHTTYKSLTGRVFSQSAAFRNHRTRQPYRKMTSFF
ncbi:hypothetical protein KSP39_PZI017113 [Platanthera zijinensis]|uniref:Uncharacterized protein n=1 Tax=Platanthera zijinensis TaxID=2320716 RepID=A0AAP0G082_9ASPA